MRFHRPNKRQRRFIVDDLTYDTVSDRQQIPHNSAVPGSNRMLLNECSSEAFMVIIRCDAMENIGININFDDDSRKYE